MKVVKNTLIVLATLAIVAVVLFFGSAAVAGYFEARQQHDIKSTQLDLLSKSIEYEDKAVTVGLNLSSSGSMQDVIVHSDCSGYDDGYKLLNGDKVKLISVESFDSKPACAQIEYIDPILGKKIGFIPYYMLDEFADVAKDDPLINK